MIGCLCRRGEDTTVSRTTSPRKRPNVTEMNSSSPQLSRTAPAPDSPLLSVQMPSSPPLSVQLPPQASSFDRNCAPLQAPIAARGRQYQVSYDQLRELCRRRRYNRKDSKTVLKTRAASTSAEDRKLGRPPQGNPNSDESQGNLKKQRRVADLHVAFVVEKEVEKGRSLRQEISRNDAYSGNQI